MIYVILLASWLAFPFITPGTGGGNTTLTLNWTAPGDDSLTGTASQYDLRMSTASINGTNFGTCQQLVVPLPQPAGKSESYVVGGLTPGTNYWFAIKTRDAYGNWSPISNTPMLSPTISGAYTSYRMTGRDPGNYQYDMRLYSSPNGGAPVPKAPGTQDTVYTLFNGGPYDPYNHSRLQGVLSGTAGPVFASFAYAVGLQDTVYFLNGNNAQWSKSIGADRACVWSVPYSDTSSVVQSQTYWIGTLKQEMIRIFGYYIDPQGVKQTQ